MSFPETRPTLIARLADGGDGTAWEQFLNDYWGPIVRFAVRIGRLPVDQAEDAASETLLVIFRSKLLLRWQNSPTGKLRSLICGVTRNLLANRQRVEQGRRNLLADLAEQGGVPGALPVYDSPEPAAANDDEDIFYQSWADDLLAQAMRAVREQLYAEGRGDYFRALYGRVCEGLSAGDIAQSLGVSAAAVENFLRIARSRLTRTLQVAVQEQVERYSPAADAKAEFEREWHELAEHLDRVGGLETAIRREAEGESRLPTDVKASKSFLALRRQLSDESRSPPGAPGQIE